MSQFRWTMSVAVLALALTGCGEKAADPGVATVDGSASPAVTSAAPVDYAKFEACLREKGVDVDASTAPEDLDTEALTEASEACREFLPIGGELPELSPQDMENARAFAKCMRDNGVPDFPDPAANGAAPNYTPPTDPDELSKITEATEVCAKNFPAPTGTPAG